MTKDKLEKEATEFEENYTVYEVAKRKDGSDYAKKVCNVTVKEAYLAGAEPREKRIVELEAQIEKMKKYGKLLQDICTVMGNDVYMVSVGLENIVKVSRLR